MISVIKNIDLKIVWNDDLGGATQKAVAGVMTIDENEKTVNFAQAAPRPVKVRNIKLYDGPLLSVVKKADGTLVMHSKAIDPSAVEDFTTKMLQEAIVVQTKINEIKKG